MPRPDKNARPYGARAMRLGDSGYDVWELQIKLIGWGSGADNDGIGVAMDPVIVNGTFDRTTADAVRRFQQAHNLEVTGVADGLLLRRVDREPADHAVLIHQLKCPCTRGVNDGPVLCRCGAHPDLQVTQKCTTGFGRGVYAGGAFTHGDNLDLYQKREYPGMDKAVIWAVRALMHRAAVPDIEVVAGYRCWWDNFHATDDTRWQHRTSTFHLGKTIDLRHRGTCTTAANAVCAECQRISAVAREKCGFQLRWHQPNRVSVSENALDARPPATPHHVHVDTVRRLEREDDDFADDDEKARKPIYEGKVGFSFPVRFELALPGRRALDPLRAPTAPFFDGTEDFNKKLAGNFPLGKNRLWHSGVHLYIAKGTNVHAIADGEIVGCRVGEAERAKALGSRNFVLVRHMRKDKPYYSLYMHLDDETAKADAAVPWRKQLFLKTKAHVRALAPSPVYKHVPAVLLPPPGTPSKLVSLGHDKGLAVGECAEITGGEVDAQTLEPTLPPSSKARKLVRAEVGDHYVLTKLDNVDVAEVIAQDDPLKDKIDRSLIIGLAKPIPVCGGDVIGMGADAPADGALSAAGNCVHLEVFSEENLITAAGYKVIDASAKDDVASRDKIRKALVDAGLLEDPTDSVLAEMDVDALAGDPSCDRLRNVILKMPSPWSLDWKDALSKSKTFSFMKDDARDALGDAFNEYRWWKDVGDGGGALPGADTVFHYHPISLLLHFAHTPET